MDNQRNQFLNWPYFFQGKNTEELTESLLVTTLELETTKVRAQEEIKLRDEQLLQLKDMLNKAINDRDEAQEKCQKLYLEKLFLHQRIQTAPPNSSISSIDDDPTRVPNSHNNNNFLSSDCEESIVSSPIISPFLEHDQDFNALITDKPLPENGKFLQAVIKAGPLLQTLLLAGPLPQWRHPPPPLDSYQIPPPPVAAPSPPPQHAATQLIHQDFVMNMGNHFGNASKCAASVAINNRKRGFCEGSDSSTESNKYQRFVLN